MKKSDGLVKGILILIITTLAFSVVIMILLEAIEVVSVDKDIDQLARAYLLEMETEGYMTASMCTRLQQQLRDMGVTDIDMSGTSLSEVGYGNPIYLKLTCVVKFRHLNLDAGIMNAFREDKEWTFYTNKMSTAKN